ncbi:DNA polymerase [Methanosalsum natronophilum]|uniref:DNA polymerase n=1 Tax=Methanosalsum natronophilum TaxID=768733 RepID=UPI002166C37E|nr:DNA polymerase [Methanosalsum natronophilum]MCS3924908.1 DNA polymerase I-like protein with 3'-5' exonuclease and polymerase domains [Methanosalsum natronophilum]
MRIIFIDIETEGLDPFTDKLVLLQLMYNGGEIKLLDYTEVLKVKQLIETSLIVGHNLKFDLKFLKYQYGINPKNVYDTETAEHVITGGLLVTKKNTTRLQDLTNKYLGFSLKKDEQTSFKRGQELTPEQIQYAENDVKYLKTIYYAQQKLIQQMNLHQTIDIEMKVLPAVVNLELAGFYFNLEKSNAFAAVVNENRNRAKELILHEFSKTTKTKQVTFNMSGETDSVFGGHLAPDINLNSSDQLIRVLGKLGLELESTGSSVLQDHLDVPVIQHLLAYRKAEKMLNTYIKKQKGYINPVTGRIHANFKQYGANTGRFSSSKPNLQNQPRTNEWRNLFTAPPGNKIITADYSQIELRILGEVAGDPEFIKAYMTGEDLHTKTASNIFNKPISQVTKEERSVAKTINFGVIYGMGPKTLQSRLLEAGTVITRQEGMKYIKQFYASYPIISNYLQDIEKHGLQELCLRNRANRHLKLARPMSEIETYGIKNKCRNLPIQSLCADILKTALASLDVKLETTGARLVNTVHDELVFEAPAQDSKTIAETITQEMVKAGHQFLKTVPVEVDVSIGECWSK